MSIGISDWQTDVEQLAIVFHISVISIVSTIAAERVAYVQSDACGIAGQGQQLGRQLLLRENLK